MPEGWSGEERRAAGLSPAALQAELRAVREDLGLVATSVASLGSDERMQEVIDSVVEEESRHRQRLLTKVVIGLLVLAGIGLSNIALTSQANETADEAKRAATNSEKVAVYLDHCLVHPSEATPGECGNTAATGQQSTAVLALFCYLRIDPAERNDANAQECFSKAAEQARAASAAVTTTTTAGRR